MTEEEKILQTRPQGDIVAINPATNRIAWKTPLPGTDGCYSGIATTAGDVSFVGDTNGPKIMRPMRLPS